MILRLICARCRDQRASWQPLLAGAAARRAVVVGAALPTPAPSTPSAAPLPLPQQHGATLAPRRAFAWWSLPPAAASSGGGGGGGPGLFGIARLQRPEDFGVWSREAIETCALLLSTTPPDWRKGGGAGGRWWCSWNAGAARPPLAPSFAHHPLKCTYSLYSPPPAAATASSARSRRRRPTPASCSAWTTPQTWCAPPRQPTTFVCRAPCLCVCC